MGELALGEVETHIVAPGEAHAWEIPTEFGHRVEGSLLQLEGDAWIAVLTPHGERLTPFDYWEDGLELFRWRSAKDGSYRLIVHSVDETQGVRYQLHLGVNEPTDGTLEQRVDQWLRTRSPQMPAALAWVVEPGQPVAMFLTGTSPQDPTRAMRPDEPLSMGRLDLALARLGVLKLIHDGALELSTPLREAAHLPLFDRRATVEHLLRDQAGVRNLESVERLRLADWSMRDLTPARFDDLALVQRESVGIPGTESAGRLADDQMTAYLQRVCATVSGKAYHAWATAELFPFFGMGDSFMLTAGPDGTRFVREYEWGERQWMAQSPRLADDRTLPMVSARDFTTWLEFLRSDAPVAAHWRREFAPLDLPWVSERNVPMQVERSKDVPERVVLTVELTSIVCGEREEIEQVVALGPWRLEHPGRFDDGRYGGRGSRSIRIPSARVPLDVSGRYRASEAQLDIALARQADGHLALIHPCREQAVRFFWNEEEQIAESRWVFAREIRFELDEQGQVTGFRILGSGNPDLLFERRVAK